MEEKGNIIIYQSEDGGVRIDVRLEEQTVWLTQQQMADLFGSSRTNVVEHIKHIYEDGELEEEATCRKFRQVRQEGNRDVTREIPYYNLDMIISVGYRIRSIIATRFRQWATERLHEYIVKGFALDDERLKNLFVTSALRRRCFIGRYLTSMQPLLTMTHVLRPHDCSLR